MRGSHGVCLEGKDVPGTTDAQRSGQVREQLGQWTRVSEGGNFWKRGEWEERVQYERGKRGEWGKERIEKCGGAAS